MNAAVGNLVIKKIGLVPYGEAWDLQKKLQRELIDNSGQQTLIGCEHPAAITFGNNAKSENLLADEETLKGSGIDIYRTERGGEVTCHSPGQIVLYPIIDLNLHKRDVNWYMRSLEEVVIGTLKVYDIQGSQVPGRTGVWIVNKNPQNSLMKIASIGIRISRWRTMHGLALNVENCLDIFKYVNPCGYKDVIMTEMRELSKIILDKNEVMNNLIKEFCRVFKYTGKEIY